MRYPGATSMLIYSAASILAFPIPLPRERKET